MTPTQCAVYRPEKMDAVRAILASATQATLIPRGLGRSYGDTALNDSSAVIDATRLDRMIDFDPESGVLECESGVSLADILAVFVPRGYFLPVTPGTKFVTVGGAIANDIHGKNHHRDGTFCQHVESLELLTASGERLICSPSENADIFWATAGGIGLTGFIQSARIRLQPVESAYMKVDYVRTANLDETLAAMARTDAEYPYAVCWIDCLARGAALGRSVLMNGLHARAADLSGAAAAKPFELPRAKRRSIPFEFPSFVLSPLSIRAFNAVVYAAHPSRFGCIVDYDKYFYPLDQVQHWNRMYGKRGFAQYQATFPKSEVAGLKRLLERLSLSQRASFLAVLKCFGPANPGPLSYPFEGYTLALDLPNHGVLTEFLRELDHIVLDHGGRIYTAKDCATTAASFAQMYPRLDEFKAIQTRLDPQRRLSSDMARRLGIVEG